MLHITTPTNNVVIWPQISNYNMSDGRIHYRGYPVDEGARSNVIANTAQAAIAATSLPERTLQNMRWENACLHGLHFLLSSSASLEPATRSCCHSCVVFSSLQTSYRVPSGWRAASVTTHYCTFPCVFLFSHFILYLVHILFFSCGTHVCMFTPMSTHSVTFVNAR